MLPQVLRGVVLACVGVLVAGCHPWSDGISTGFQIDRVPEMECVRAVLATQLQGITVDAHDISGGIKDLTVPLADDSNAAFSYRSGNVEYVLQFVLHPKHPPEVLNFGRMYARATSSELVEMQQHLSSLLSVLLPTCNVRPTEAIRFRCSGQECRDLRDKAPNNRIERRVNDKVPSSSVSARGAHAER